MKLEYIATNKKGENTMKQIKLEEIRDLTSRLYYCSNSKEGNKMRRWIERKIKKLEREIEEVTQ